MKEYRTVEEIREEAKQQTISWYKTLCKVFSNHPTMEISCKMSDTALTLVKQYGLTWDEVEALEIA